MKLMMGGHIHPQRGALLVVRIDCQSENIAKEIQIAETVLGVRANVEVHMLQSHDTSHFTTLKTIFS